MPAETRFIADVMLGKLATWMRLLGCDVEYFPKISDEDLVERAFRTGRVILTRDTERVPPYTYETQHDFKTCDHCGRIYWRGTHRDEAVKQVMAIFGVHE